MSRESRTGVSSLYPFLERAGENGGSDIEGIDSDAAGIENEALQAVKVEVAASSVVKMAEIAELRRRVLAEDGERLVACAEAMAARFAAGGRILVYGNGGSSTDAQDLARLFVNPPAGRLALPALGLTNDVAVMTALANDVGFDVVFARQLGAFGCTTDIAVGLSTSGNSDNLLHGFDAARRLGMLTVGLAGADGGKMAGLGSIDHLFVVSSPSVHRVQEAQTTIYHVLWELTVDAVTRRRSGSLATEPVN